VGQIIFCQVFQNKVCQLLACQLAEIAYPYNTIKPALEGNLQSFPRTAFSSAFARPVGKQHNRNSTQARVEMIRAFLFSDSYPPNKRASVPLR
jgi:hypothetical protein